jgi:hypothetical protein
MTTRNKNSNPKLLPVLAALIVLCLLGAAALTLLTHSVAPVAAPAEQLSLVVQRMPFEAQNALRGEASAFDALAKSVARLKTLHGAAPGATLLPRGGLDRGSGLEQIQRRGGDGRRGAAAVEPSRREPGGARAGAEAAVRARRPGERRRGAEARGHEPLPGALRTHGAAHSAGPERPCSGVSDAAPAAQRLADSLEFLSQVMRGLSGEESGLAPSPRSPARTPSSA